MKNYKISTSGEIVGIPHRKQMEWRDELETSLRINVVGIGNANINHPWIQLCVNHIKEAIEETADYIINYLLV